MIYSGRERNIVWLIFLLVTIAGYGNFYVYDSIGPIADLLQRQRDFSDPPIGMHHALYSLPTVVLRLRGGVWVDALGVARFAFREGFADANDGGESRGQGCLGFFGYHFVGFAKELGAVGEAGGYGWDAPADGRSRGRFAGGGGVCCLRGGLLRCVSVARTESVSVAGDC